MLKESQALDVMYQLMQGFKELVENGYIHRDIKPQNSLIKKGVHKVADFGFATKVDMRGRQLMKECVGTPLYMVFYIKLNLGSSAFKRLTLYCKKRHLVNWYGLL